LSSGSVHALLLKKRIGALPQLLNALPRQPARHAWTQHITHTKADFKNEIATELEPQLKWLNAIRKALPENGIFVDELTQIGYVSSVPVVSIAGDGGAMFTIAELATAVHHNIPLNIVVMNDNAFGNVKGIQRDKYEERYIASDLTSPDFVKLAEAIANPGPNLIEVPVGEFPSPWKYILLPKLRSRRRKQLSTLPQRDSCLSCCAVSPATRTAR